MSPRFKIGDAVWVRDIRPGLIGGYRIIPGVVVEKPYERNGQWYFPLDSIAKGEKGLYWLSYPACRVFATYREAVEARVSIE